MSSQTCYFARAKLFRTASSKKLEHGRRLIYAGVPSFFGLGLEDGHVPSFWLLHIWTYVGVFGAAGLDSCLIFLCRESGIRVHASPVTPRWSHTPGLQKSGSLLQRWNPKQYLHTWSHRDRVKSGSSDGITTTFSASNQVGVGSDVSDMHCS